MVDNANIAMLEILTWTLITNRAILDQRQYMRARGPMKIERARNCKKRFDLAIYRGPLITGDDQGDKAILRLSPTNCIGQRRSCLP